MSENLNRNLNFDALTSGIEPGGLRSKGDINTIICYTVTKSKAKLTQNDLSKLCNIANTTLSGYESNYREPSFETLEKLANECGYKIQFKNEKTGEILTSENINRKEI